MTWRPEGWDVGKIISEGLAGDIMSFTNLVDAGADAMLEALRKKGTHLTQVEISQGIEPETRQFEIPIMPGTWVFIPDEAPHNRKLDSGE